MDRGVWRVVGPRAAESDMIEQLSTHTLQVNARENNIQWMCVCVCVCVYVCVCVSVCSVI